MKIWVIGRNYPDECNNLQGSFELEQAKMLAKRGNDVTYIACVLHPFRRIKNGGFVEFKDAFVRVVAYSGFFTPHMADPVIQFPYFPKLRNKKWNDVLIKAEEATGCPDVIHIHFPLMILSAEVFKKYHDRGVKVVVTEHWSKVINKRIDKYETQQMNAFLNYVDAYFAVGYSLKKAIKELTDTSREILVVPNIINDLFKPSDKLHDGFRFGIVGRLAPEKQMDKVLESFAENFKGDQNIRMVIVGDGAERENLKKQTKILGITAQVEFKGRLSREETAEAVKNLDCLVCFSKYETFGVPVIEAWACGIPVITTTADCITDHWDERMGISVDRNDINALIEAMARMVQNIGSYNRNYISRIALNSYSEDSVSKLLLSVYKASNSGD